MNVQRRELYIIVNGEKRKIKRVFIGHNGKAYKFVGTEERDDRKKVFIFSPDENDSREVNSDEIYEFYQSYCTGRNIIRFL